MSFSETSSVSEVFLNDVILGLSREQRTLPSSYLYDQRGSQLFDQICELDEYYLTRTELAIMQDHAAEMAQQLDDGVLLVELGSGSSVKTRLLLDACQDFAAAYVPIDISAEHLHDTAEQLRDAYPDLEILPKVADFTRNFELPESSESSTHTAVYFPGSTIGNLLPGVAGRLMGRISRMVGKGGGLLIGIDLQKDPGIILPAYDDARGVTAEFSLNYLKRMNEELDADFDIEAFEHRAIYNDDLGRVEISLVSQASQVVTIENAQFQFEPGDSILTEYSHKYTVDGFCEFASEFGFACHRHWTDAKGLFAVLHLVVED